MEVEEYTFKELLSRIVDNRGRTCPTAETGTALIATNCIKDDQLYPVFEKVRWVDQETMETWFRGHPEPGDILFVLKGSPGRCCLVPDPINFCIAQDMLALRADETKVSQKFLFALLRSSIVRNAIDNLHVGTMIPHFKKGDFDQLRFQIPKSRKIQEWIGEQYFILSDKIELNRRMNATLEGMAQALFKSWFVDFDPVLDNAILAGSPIPDEFAERAKVRRKLLEQNQNDECSVMNDELNESSTQNSSLRTHHSLFPATFQETEAMGWIPEGWKAAKLSDLLVVKYGKDHKKLSEGSIPVYGSGGLMRYADKSLYSGESVLIPRKGTLSNILYLKEEFWTVDTMFYTIPKHEHAPKYAFYHLKGLDFTSMNVGSAVPSMTTKVLNELPIIIPDDISLKCFNEILTSYFDKSEANNKQSQSLTKLRDTLLPKLISGELSTNL